MFVFIYYSYFQEENEDYTLQMKGYFRGVFLSCSMFNRYMESIFMVNRERKVSISPGNLGFLVEKSQSAFLWGTMCNFMKVTVILVYLLEKILDISLKVLL